MHELSHEVTSLRGQQSHLGINNAIMRKVNDNSFNLAF